MVDSFQHPSDENESGKKHSAREETEHALHEKAEKFSKIFYASRAFLFVSELSTGVFIEANDSYCALTGYAREELIGHSTLELGIVSSESREKTISKPTKHK